MKFVKIISPEKLEKELENRVKAAYADKDYLRCNNLIKHLLKVNSTNSVGLYYQGKLTPSLLKETKAKWVWVKTLKSYLTDFRVYLVVSLFVFLGRIK